MSEAAGEDWRAAVDEVDARLVDGYQSGFPVEQRPFRAVGDALGVPPEEVAAVVNSYRQVDHNDRRDHEWNTWFVVTACR